MATPKRVQTGIFLKSLPNNQISEMVFSGRLEPDSVRPASIVKHAAMTSSPPNKTWKNELIAYGQNSGSSVKLIVSTLVSSTEVNSTWLPDWPMVVVLEYIWSYKYERSLFVVTKVSLIGSAQWISFFSPCPRNHLQLKLVVNAPFEVFIWF